jgi:hypothetical protein
VVSSTPRPQFTPVKVPVPILQEAGWAPGPFWTGAENLAPTGIRSPDRPDGSSVVIPTELPGPLILKCIFKNWAEGGMDWVLLADNRDRWQNLVNAMVNLRIP